MPDNHLQPERLSSASIHQRVRAISSVVGNLNADSLALFQHFQRHTYDTASTGIARPPPGANASSVATASGRVQEFHNTALGGPQAMAQRITGLLAVRDQAQIDALPANIRAALAAARTFLGSREATPELITRFITDRQLGPVSRLAAQIALGHQVRPPGSEPGSLMNLWRGQTAHDGRVNAGQVTDTHFILGAGAPGAAQRQASTSHTAPFLTTYQRRLRGYIHQHRHGFPRSTHAP